MLTSRFLLRPVVDDIWPDLPCYHSSPTFLYSPIVSCGHYLMPLTMAAYALPALLPVSLLYSGV